jgi:hypothetical protein
MKTAIKLLTLFILLVLSTAPLLMASVYVFSGLDKTVFIQSLASIPADKFWMTGVPLFIVCFFTTLHILLSMMNVNSKPAPRKPLSVDDPDLGSKLRRLYI